MALVEIWRRPRRSAGPKRLWPGLSFVDFVGPVCYFVFGRRKSRQEETG